MTTMLYYLDAGYIDKFLANQLSDSVYVSPVPESALQPACPSFAEV